MAPPYHFSNKRSTTCEPPWPVARPRAVASCGVQLRRRWAWELPFRDDRPLRRPPACPPERLGTPGPACLCLAFPDPLGDQGRPNCWMHGALLGPGQPSWPFTIENRAKAPRPASGVCLIYGTAGRLSRSYGAAGRLSREPLAKAPVPPRPRLLVTGLPGRRGSVRRAAAGAKNLARLTPPGPACTREDSPVSQRISRSG